MPTVDEHKKKYNINKQLLTNELKLDKCTCYDWISVVAFYSALHLIEGELAKGGIHSPDHSFRRRTIDMISNYSNVRRQFKVLYDRSRIARYGPLVVDKGKAEHALQCLEQIEKEITL